MFEIEKNVKMPELSRGHQGKYPWDEMEVGDSFFIPRDAISGNASQLARHRKARGEAHTVRKVEGGWRIWRTA